MIRPATPEDAEGIARVHVRGWQRAYAHVFPADELAALSVEQRTQRWRSMLGRSHGTHVAESEGTVIGFVNAGPSHDDDGDGIGELHGIYVDPDHWDTGAGRELAATADDVLRAGGFTEATLWVLDDNPRARRFYEAGGWRPDGTTRIGNHLGVETHELRYRKRLS